MTRNNSFMMDVSMITPPRMDIIALATASLLCSTLISSSRQTTLVVPTSSMISETLSFRSAKGRTKAA